MEEVSQTIYEPVIGQSEVNLSPFYNSLIGKGFIFTFSNIIRSRMTVEEFKTLALSFPGTMEAPHFDRTAFKVIKKRIFATLHEGSGTANLKLSEVDQSVFSDFDKTSVYPVPNKWGLQGWTTFELKNLPQELLLDALETAYKDVLKDKKK